ncbi:MAG: hypothetical protein Greene041619_832 [Candidatus Peregrinibacteria bacterium Greene0416_19]|nr:MAG: hypothetical protein Greene041619_832 [Candidatus Peregrinibacteria bacterium Greene0416_19]
MINLLTILRQYEDLCTKERKWQLDLGKVVGMKAKHDSRLSRLTEGAKEKERRES